jgi:hypothetical protein
MGRVHLAAWQPTVGNMQVTLFTSLLLTALTVLISIAGLLIFRRKLVAQDLKEQHEVTDPYSQFVGMLFAVLLGFMVADAMTRFSAARQTVQLEASAVANVFRIAEGMPEDTRQKLRALCLDYCQVVVDDEWPKLKVKKPVPKRGRFTVNYGRRALITSQSPPDSKTLSPPSSPRCAKSGIAAE